MQHQIDYLLIGPAYPYRGGIADSQNELALSLTKLGKEVKLYTFTKLYPNFLFPGVSQFSKKTIPKSLSIERCIHSYNPINWFKVSKKINSIDPKVVIFRYYTPLLSICYFNLIRLLNKNIRVVALILSLIHI